MDPPPQLLRTPRKRATLRGRDSIRSAEQLSDPRQGSSAGEQGEHPWSLVLTHKAIELERNVTLSCLRDGSAPWCFLVGEPDRDPQTLLRIYQQTSNITLFSAQSAKEGISCLCEQRSRRWEHRLHALAVHL